MNEHEEEDDEGGGLSLELLQSYLAFGKRAIRERWRVSAVVISLGVALVVLAVVYWPRTYACTTTLLAVNSVVLDGRDDRTALAGAPDIIMRHENLEAIIRDTELLAKSDERRPPLLRLKDQIQNKLRGPLSAKLLMQGMVGTLEARLNVTVNSGVLTVVATWSDARTAAELAEAARQSFVAARHTAEISAFEDKMAILDGHALKLRDEIRTIAQQLKSSRDDRTEQVREQRTPATAAAGQPQPSAPPTLMRAPRKLEPDAQLPALREKLEPLKAKLALLESDRDRRIREEKAKFEEMSLRLTPQHPEVITEGQRVAMLSQVPSDIALMRAEVKDLESEIAARASLSKQTREAIGSPTGVGRAPQVGETTAEPLPYEITELLSKDNLDPALSAQLDGAVTKYTALRTDMLSTRIDLDTAQAAFNHRYQIIVPAEVPVKPEKPKPAVMIGGGLAVTLALALLLPVISALRAGVITARWQVEHLRVPVLAELHLPPHSSD